MQIWIISHNFKKLHHTVLSLDHTYHKNIHSSFTPQYYIPYVGADTLNTGKMVHEYGLPRGQRSPSFHRVDTVRTLQKSA